MPETALVLTYHSISDAGGPTSIDADTFVMQMATLAEAGFRSQTLGEFLAWHGGNGDGDRRVLITFDDAFADFASTAAPIMAHHGFTGLVFTPSAKLGGVEDWVGANAPPRPLMTREDVRALAQDGFEFGGHSRTHANLTKLDAAACEAEIADCAGEIAAITGTSVASFAAPYGAVNADVIAAIGRHYRAGFGTRLARAVAGADLFDLPRIEMHYFRVKRRWRALLDGRSGYFRVRQGLRAVREAVGG